MSDVLIVIGLLVAFSAIGNAFGTRDENRRIYEKCLVELEDVPHKEAIKVCEDRVGK